jgi:hypothetical protein
MKLPRGQFTIRRMMIALETVGAAFAGRKTWCAEGVRPTPPDPPFTGGGK